MREIRLSGLEGGVVDIRHPYPYFIAKVAYPSIFLLFFSGRRPAICSISIDVRPPSR